MSHTFQRIKAPATTPQSTLGFTAVLLALIAGLLAWHFHSRVEDFQDNQRRLMQGNVNATAIAISNYVRHLRRSVELFANDRETLLSPLAQAPDNPQMYQQLLTDIGNHFPQHLAFTIADSQGEPLLQKMDALVGNGCRKDIRRFANQLDAHRLYIHSSPQDTALRSNALPGS